MHSTRDPFAHKGCNESYKTEKEVKSLAKEKEMWSIPIQYKNNVSQRTLKITKIEMIRDKITDDLTKMDRFIL